MLLRVMHPSVRITTNMTLTPVDSSHCIPCGPTMVGPAKIDVQGSGQGDRAQVNNKRAWSVRRSLRELHLNFVVRDCSRPAIYFGLCKFDSVALMVEFWWMFFFLQFVNNVISSRFPVSSVTIKSSPRHSSRKKCHPFTNSFFKSEACFHWY